MRERSGTKADICPAPGRRLAQAPSAMTGLPVTKYGNTLSE
ncbi:hypothetical protein [Paenibacillus methanolicus]|nr:hypothetical protein [Paenibacillus methanolicus]